MEAKVFSSPERVPPRYETGYKAKKKRCKPRTAPPLASAALEEPQVSESFGKRTAASLTAVLLIRVKDQRDAQPVLHPRPALCIRWDVDRLQLAAAVEYVIFL